MARRSLERAKRFVDQTDGTQDCATYRDFRDVIARPDLDAVVIATPDPWHAIQTIWARRERVCCWRRTVAVESRLRRGR